MLLWNLFFPFAHLPVFVNLHCHLSHPPGKIRGSLMKCSAATFLKATRGKVSAGSSPHPTAHFSIIQYEPARERPVCLCLHFVDIFPLFHPSTLPRSLCLRFRFRGALTSVLSPHWQSFHKPTPFFFSSLCIFFYLPILASLCACNVCVHKRALISLCSHKFARL